MLFLFLEGFLLPFLHWIPSTQSLKFQLNDHFSAIVIQKFSLTPSPSVGSILPAYAPSNPKLYVYLELIDATIVCTDYKLGQAISSVIEESVFADHCFLCWGTGLKKYLLMSE